MRFRGNTSLTKFNEFRFFTGVTRMNYNSKEFNSCSYLTELTLPVNLATIEGETIQATNRLNILTCLRMTAPAFGGQNNIGTSAPDKILRVPKGSTGYDSGGWLSTMITRFHFTLEYF